MRICYLSGTRFVKVRRFSWVAKEKVVTVIFFSFTNKCYIPGITSHKGLLSLIFAVLLQKVSN